MCVTVIRVTVMRITVIRVTVMLVNKRTYSENCWESNNFAERLNSVWRKQHWERNDVSCKWWQTFTNSQRWPSWFIFATINHTHLKNSTCWVLGHVIQRVCHTNFTCSASHANQDLSTDDEDDDDGWFLCQSPETSVPSCLTHCVKEGEFIILVII